MISTSRFRQRRPHRGPHVARRAVLRRPVLVLAALSGAALAAACGPGDREGVEARRDARARAGCATLDTGRVVGLAVAEFVSRIEPKPLRFLYMSGTDSMLPEGGVRQLQDRGPTYLWPADDRQRPVVEKRLSDAGPWNALLVTYRGVAPEGDGVRVGVNGHWVGPDSTNGKPIAPGRYTFECSSAGDSAYAWRLTNGAAPAATATPTATPSS